MRPLRRLRHPIAGSLGLVVIGQMLRKSIRSWSTRPISTRPSSQIRYSRKWRGRRTAIAGRLHAVSAVPKMVGPRSRDDLRTSLASGALRIIDHVEDGANQERPGSAAALAGRIAHGSKRESTGYHARRPARSHSGAWNQPPAVRCSTSSAARRPIWPMNSAKLRLAVDRGSLPPV